MDEGKILKLVEKNVTKLVDLMGLKDSVTVSVTKEEDGDDLVIKVSIDGNDLGFMIGPRGQHLESMQHVIKLMMYKDLDEDDEFDLIVDAGGYVADRMQKLQEFAMRKADDARIMGTPIDLGPMRAFDRKIVHTAISKFDDVYTESEGEGIDRHVRIIPRKDSELGIGGTDDGVTDSEETESSEE